MARRCRGRRAAAVAMPQASSTHVGAVAEAFSGRVSMPRRSFLKQVRGVANSRWGRFWRLWRLGEVAPTQPPPSFFSLRSHRRPQCRPVSPGEVTKADPSLRAGSARSGSAFRRGLPPLAATIESRILGAVPAVREGEPFVREVVMGAALDRVRVLFGPTAEFERVREKPRFLAPFLALAVITVVITALQLPYTKAALDRKSTRLN